MVFIFKKLNILLLLSKVTTPIKMQSYCVIVIWPFEA